MPRYRYILIVLAVCAASWAVYQLWPIQSNKLQTADQTKISKAEFANLDNLAEAACLCRFVGGKISQCNEEFEKAAKSVPLQGFGTASYPISSTVECLPSGPPNCIAHSYNIVGQDAFVCTNDQADELEAVWAKVQDGKAGSTQKADRALMAALKRMKSAEILKVKAATVEDSN